MKTLQVPTLPVSTQLKVILDQSAAKREINVAWEQYKQSTISHYRNGMGFGRVCHEWRTQYRAQGSRTGKGFDHLLEELGIPKTTAYRWIKRYEVKYGLRAKRNEVEDTRLKLDADSPVDLNSGKTELSFQFVLTEERRYQFEEDIKTLGGRKRVTDMFVEFVSRKASERRESNVPKKESGRGYEGVRRIAVIA